MRVILIIIFAVIALSIAATLLGPLIVLGIGAAFAYYAYQNLVKENKSFIGIIWWVIVGATGISMVVGVLPKFIFIAAIAALVYLAFKKSNTLSQPKASQDESTFSEYKSFEA